MKNGQLLMILACLAVMMGCGGAPSETPPAPVEVETVEVVDTPDTSGEARHDFVYVCACGPDCECNSVATEPGNCTCGKELTQAHLLKIEGNEGLLCTCGNDCTCEIDAEDATKCGCGSPVRRVSFEGTGLYFCNCGGSCDCNHVSAEAGKCGCGMDLITSA